MLISDFDFPLPEHLIAQEPLENREDSRMLIIDRTRNRFRDAVFTDLPALLQAGDVLVVNNTKVFPARLQGSLETGAAVEILLIEEMPDGCWTALARPGRRLSVGRTIHFSDALKAIVVEKLEKGRVAVRFETDSAFDEVLGMVGLTPLPPYIRRAEGGLDQDRERYQTVFAANRGAIAAPTAGLHFTAGMLDRIRSGGVIVVEITLHVGYGTFGPVRVIDLSDHTVLPEKFTIGEHAALELNSAFADGRRIVAVGTTTTRALESSMNSHGKFVAESSVADLTIRPGYKFKAVNALLTNFHLPKSSLLVLVSTFGGRELIMESYKHAVASNYRFYSYGDCMFIT